MRSESAHAEVTRLELVTFDLVFSGISRERFSEGFEECHQMLRSCRRWEHEYQKYRDCSRKENGITHRPKKQSMDACRYPGNRKESMILPNLQDAAGQRGLYSAGKEKGWISVSKDPIPRKKWDRTPLIPALSDFQASYSYVVRSCVQRKKGRRDAVDGRSQH